MLTVTFALAAIFLAAMLFRIRSYHKTQAIIEALIFKMDTVASLYDPPGGPS